MKHFIKAAKANEIGAGKSKCIDVEGGRVALFNIGNVFYAVDNVCPHRGGPLCEGPVNAGQVTCPWHGSIFDVATGKVLQGPATENVATYATRVLGTDIEIEVTAQDGVGTKEITHA